MAANWCTAADTAMLSQVSRFFFEVVKAWQYQNILDQLDDAAWDDISEEWNTYLCERNFSLAV